MLVPQAASTGLSTGASTGTASFDQVAIVTGFVALMYVGLAVLLWRERTGRETVVGRQGAEKKLEELVAPKHRACIHDETQPSAFKPQELQVIGKNMMRRHRNPVTGFRWIVDPFRNQAGFAYAGFRFFEHVRGNAHGGASPAIDWRKRLHCLGVGA